MSEKRISDEDLAYFRRDMSAMDGEHVDMLLDEVISLRAAALTRDEREALKSARAILVREFESDEIMLGPEIVAETKRLALSALDRIIAAAEVKS